MTHLINNVEILYPRINQCYRFDNSENKSVPCDPFEDGAKYETKFRMTKEQAKELYSSMAKAYAERKEKSWPEKLDMPFEKDEEIGCSKKWLIIFQRLIQPVDGIVRKHVGFVERFLIGIRFDLGSFEFFAVQFEHTLKIAARWCEIFCRSPKRE